MAAPDAPIYAGDTDAAALAESSVVAHLGFPADPDAIRTVAMAAEQAGMASVWAIAAPRTIVRLPGSTDGVLPAEQDIVLDPLVALTVAATVTERVRLGTDVLVAPRYPPVLSPAASPPSTRSAAAGSLPASASAGQQMSSTPSAHR